MSTSDRAARRPRSCEKNVMRPAFIVGGASSFLTGSINNAVNVRSPLRTSRLRVPRRYAAAMMVRPPSRSGQDEERKGIISRSLQLVRVAVVTIGVFAGNMFGLSGIGRRESRLMLEPVQAEGNVNVIRVGGSEEIPLKALGIKQSDYLSERELRLRKTTQYSEAEQEIMELQEYEMATKWYRDLQRLWAGLASVAGIYVLYKGGVLWERWIQEQERKDMEEEIELTGTFISPRAVRKDDDEDDKKQRKGKGKGSGGGDDDGKPPVVGDSPPGGIQSLEKLLGNN